MVAGKKSRRASKVRLNARGLGSGSGLIVKSRGDNENWHILLLLLCFCIVCIAADKLHGVAAKHKHDSFEREKRQKWLNNLR